MHDTSFIYIDTDAALQEFCRHSASAPVVAVDTEFNRDKTYYPQLCLIQIAAAGQIACIDPLAAMDLLPLRTLLGDHNVVKVLHAARQDIEVVWHALRCKLEPIFDSQYAARFLGMHEQISYAALVEELVAIKLPKSQTRTDWCQRPLSPAQLHYAADDVRHLISVYPILQQRLLNGQRLTWFAEECQALSDKTVSVGDDTTLWQTISGVHHLAGAQLAVLRALAAWREAQARQRNRPRQWIVRDETLIGLAQAATTTGFERSTVWTDKSLSTYRDQLMAIIDTAKQQPSSSWPVAMPPAMLTAQQKNLLRRLTECVHTQAQQHTISPTLLATRKELERLINGDRSIPLLHGWRAQLAGHAVLPLLASSPAAPTC